MVTTYKYTTSSELINYFSNYCGHYIRFYSLNFLLCYNYQLIMLLLITIEVLSILIVFYKCLFYSNMHLIDMH